MNNIDMISIKVFTGFLVAITGILFAGALIYYNAPELQYPWGYYPNLVAGIIGLIGTVLGLLGSTTVGIKMWYTSFLQYKHRSSVPVKWPYIYT